MRSLIGSVGAGSSSVKFPSVWRCARLRPPQWLRSPGVCPPEHAWAWPRAVGCERGSSNGTPTALWCRRRACPGAESQRLSVAGALPDTPVSGATLWSAIWLAHSAPFPGGCREAPSLDGLRQRFMAAWLLLATLRPISEWAEGWISGPGRPSYTLVDVNATTRGCGGRPPTSLQLAVGLRWSLGIVGRWRAFLPNRHSGASPSR